MKKISAVFLFAMVLSILWVSVAGAEAKAIEVTVQIGNETVDINGAKTTVAKPYLANNVTLVPLRVITSAFGAEVTWEQKTNTIGLIYEGRSISLQIGSKKVKVDGKESNLEAAPELKNGTTMVPLRFITQNFGAEVAYEAATSKITIKKRASAGDGGESGSVANQDAGKTHIGDSYLGWSISFVPELSHKVNLYNGNLVTFQHLKDDYELLVWVMEEQPELSPQGLIKKLGEFTGNNTVLSQGFNKEGSYAVQIVKEPNATVTEMRLYSKGDRQYLATINTSNDNFNNKQKWEMYNALLNTFTLSFDQGNPAYKDISNVKDGLRLIEMDEYGLSIKVPAKWYRSQTPLHRLDYFFNDDQSQYFQSQVTSRDEDDTPEAWADRIGNQYKNQYAASFLQLGELAPVTIDGVSGVARTSYISEGVDWSAEYEIFLMEGNYKYYFAIGYPKELSLREQTQLQANIVNSIKIDQSKMSKNVDQLYDSWDNMDYNYRVTLNNDKAKYSAQIPEYWLKSSDHDGGYNIEYLYPGIEFDIYAYQNKEFSLQDALHNMDANLRNEAEEDSSFKLNSKTTVNKFGVQVYKYDMSYKLNGVNIQHTEYFFEKNDMLYIIVAVVKEPFATESTLKRIEDTMDSIEFNP